MKRTSPMGAVTVITAIMVLCMAVFAALSYSSGMAELRMTKAGVQAVEDYYRANTQAAELVADAIQDGETRVVADIPAGERQTLHIEAEIVDGRARVTQWRTVADTGDEEVFFLD